MKDDYVPNYMSLYIVPYNKRYVSVLIKNNSSALGIIVRIQFSSVAQLCPTLCDPMNHSTPGLPVHLQLLEFTQTHVH